MFDVIKKYTTEVLQDVDGFYSFKRFSVLIVLMLLVTVVIGTTFLGLHFQTEIMNTLAELMKWGLGFIAAEHAPKLMGRSGAGDSK